MDLYSNYKELAKNEILDNSGNGDYRIEFMEADSSVLILAPHGGKIEPHTSIIAKQIAGEDFSFYLFEGTKQTHNFNNLHITSTNFDEPICLKLLEAADTSVAIHGKQGAGGKILIGGLNEELANLIENSLKQAGFNSEVIRTGHLSGTNSKNICNRTKTGKGTQLEIEKGLRDQLKLDEELFIKFTTSIRDAIFKYIS